MQVFLNLMFRYNIISLTNKPTCVIRHSANAIYFKSDHFPTVFAIKTNETTQRPVVKSTYKRFYCKKILTILKIFYTTEIAIILKKLKTTTKHINTFSISLLIFMTSRSQNRKLKLNLKVFQNHQERNKDLMKNS